MANCTYETIVDGKKVVFNSEWELDTFLKNNYSEYKVDEIHKTFSTDVQAEALNKLTEAEITYSKAKFTFERINDDGDVEVTTKIPHSISTTKVFTEFGRPDDWSRPAVTPFDLAKWKDNIRQKIINDGGTKQDANELIGLYEHSWKVLTDYGNEVHDLFDSIINNTEFTPKKLSGEQVTRLKEQFESFVSDLKQKFGNNAKFYSEFAIKSRQLNDSFKTLLTDITSINGRIDLLVIDENGKAHVYDFKVSRKKVGEWNETNNKIIAENGTWHSTKKLSAAYQLVFYRRMLEQYGIPVDSINVIPIDLDISYQPDGIEIKSLDGVTFNTENIISNMKDTEPGGKIYNNVSSLLPINLEVTDPVDVISNLYNQYNKAFPDNTGSRKFEARQATFEYYRFKKKNFITKLNEGDPGFKQGKFRFWNEMNNKPVYAKDDTDLNEKIQEYVNQLNEQRDLELVTLAGRINEALDGKVPVSELSNDSNKTKSAFVEKHLKRYIVNNWKFIRNDDLNQIGIFIFKKDAMCEIISITNNDLFKKINLGLGTNLLGRHLTDLQINPRSSLDANAGNLEIMKVMFYLNQNAQQFQDVHINSIKSLNIWQQQYIEHANSIVQENFDKLTKYEGIRNNLVDNKSVIFNNDVNALVEMAHNFIEDQSDLRVVNWEIAEDINTVELKKDWLLSKIEELRKNYGNVLTDLGQINPEDPRWVAYTYLFKALDRLMGYNYYFEANPARWLGFGPDGVTLGTFVTSIQNADSKNARELGRIFALYRDKIRKQQTDYLSRYRQKFQDFYNEQNQIKIWGNEARYFRNWFVEVDNTGEIDPAFILKRPTDPSLGVKEKIALETFLEIVNELRYNNDAEAIEEAKNTGDYYQVPLLRAKFRRQLKQKGVVQGLKDQWDETKNLLNVFQEQAPLKSKYESEKLQVYNRFNMDNDTREKLIADRGIADFETDLEQVLLSVVEQYATQKTSNEFVPLIQGLKMGLVVQQAFGGGDISNLIEFIDKYLKTNLYNEPIMDESLRPLYRILAMFKSVTSLTGLGFNYISGTREILQGSYIGFSRTVTGLYGKDLFTTANWLKANKILIEEAPKSIGKLNMLELINWTYGMANSGASELTGDLRINKLGISNWGSDQMFFFSKAPDMLHRMAWLISKMLQDGNYEAHTLVNDELIYDFTKDGRFTQFIEGNKNHKDYRFQKELYLKTVEQFNAEGANLNPEAANGKDYGDPLPRAYTNREAIGIKNIADTCFGHYDKDTQSAMKNMFLGSFFLQFRTFITAKLEQWVMKPGVYNVENLKQVYNEDGVRMVQRYTYDENGNPIVDIIPETELRPNDTIWKPHLEWQGTPMKGIAYSMWSYIKALSKLDAAEFKKLWQDPLDRANLILFLHDMGLMLILGLLVLAAAEGWDGIKEKPWAQRSAIMALYGSFQDGPIHNILGGMVGDLNPPTYKSIQGMFDTAGAVITGNSNLWDAATKNVGALRQLHQVSALW